MQKPRLCFIVQNVPFPLVEKYFARGINLYVELRIVNSYPNVI